MNPAPSSPGLLQPIVAGVLSSVVGFASTFAVVLHGYASVGATPAQAAGGLLMLCLAQGLLSIWLSTRWRMPVTLAWSTPGSALLAASGLPEGGFAVAAGAFLVAAALIVAAGLWKPFGRAVAAIPTALASAMLAGILFEICLAPVRAASAMPAVALPVILAWALAWRFARLYAVPVAVLAAAAVMLLVTTLPPGLTASVAWPEFIMPRFTLTAAIGLGVPLFLVTMASQNVPGLAVMHAHGYRPEPGPIFTITGLASAVIAFFGAHAVNLAAITAALCAGRDAHPDPAKRWVASVSGGVGYWVLGLGAGLAATFVAAAPPLLIQTVAGLALLATLGGALTTAATEERTRLPAMATFVTTASGLSVMGIGAAFWGLLAGGALMLLDRLKR
ncbi:benzoate/H(+) symporter BenE family transporter [Pseudoroseomonas ludipueritiae]|uniref:Benzoate/H(+) symporter BenE family transporter n=1 Tax=Pseudoroseomonas ludipueritiae TaxID=198093 RepID=A0ABR7RAH1_9PROT|nr:benzoate/H(+) symporter BenE family transporter [Pseudoroseomonas ludipueritiae]MBC9178819.1 benzoate/H(+) symporter BenE family transporter [Pseudoroseomonas ludipueritiae]